MKSIKSIIGNNRGQNMVEYGLLIALIAVAVLLVLIFLGPRIASVFQSADNQLTASG